MSGELQEPSIPDEAWEAFQQESEGPARLAAPKEPSARARMVTERLRREDEAAARGQGRVRRAMRGKRRSAAVRAEPDGWRAWPSGQQRQARRRRLRGLAWVLVAIVAVLLIMNPEKTLSWLTG
jgi:hypothetical protein